MSHVLTITKVGLFRTKIIKVKVDQLDPPLVCFMIVFLQEYNKTLSCEQR